MLPLSRRDKAAPPPEPLRFEAAPGTMVAGKYRVERTLGEGGMGLVVAATHLALEQPVAIKFLLPEAVRSKVAVERFLREARVAAKVRCEYVARVYDVGTVEDGVPYIVMEYLVGCDLGDLIAEAGALSVEEAAEIALQACEALAEVHAAGIVHRDLKPSNLFVTRRSDGSPAVKLLDFGISKLTSSGDEPTVDPALTATATIMGSPSYMSPEQLKSTKEVDARADVWSLGAVLYEALTGKPAFRGETVPQVCAMIASEDPVLPSATRDGIPLDLERAVLGCLDKDASRRSTLVDLARALARFAPERTRPSLERIEAVLGAPPRSQAERAATRPALPVLPLATSDRTRTVAAWGARERKKRARGGTRVVGLGLGLAAFVFGVVSGRLHWGSLRGELAGATRAVASAASAVSAAASAIPALPLPSTLPVPSSLTAALEDMGLESDAGVSEDSDDDDDASAAREAAPRVDAGALAHGSKGHPAPKTKHVTNTKAHRRHP